MGEPSRDAVHRPSEESSRLARYRPPACKCPTDREEDGHLLYTLSNAPLDTPIEQLAKWQCQRYFIERANQDAKSELGFGDFCARKYLACQHHLALTALAAWFVARAKLEWAQAHPTDLTLLRQFEVDTTPRLSTRNIRLMLRAIFPLEQISAHQAEARIVQQLISRTRSRRSRRRTAAAPS